MGIFDSFKKTIGFYDVEYDDDFNEIENNNNEDDNVIKPSFFNKKKKEEKESYLDYKRELHRNDESSFEKENYTPIKESFSKNMYSSNSDSGNFEKKDASINISIPNSFEDSTLIVDTLKDRKAVVLNTTKLDIKVAQRLLDFVAGATYSLKGDIREVQEGIYVITPNNVKISDDYKKDETIKGLFNFKK